MRVVIVGGRSFGVAVAERVSLEHEVVAVWTDECDPLEQWAHDRGLPALIEPTPESLAEWEPDVLVGAHNFKFLSSNTRAVAKYGAIGYHPSLLPRHRGNDSVRETIEAGDPVTGGTVYQLDDGWDTGPILLQRFRRVRKDDDASSLWRRELFPLGVLMLQMTLRFLEQGTLEPRPQDERFADRALPPVIT